MTGTRAHLTFLLNGELHRVSGIAPAMTLLQWLRRDQRLTGTKEGCAEGDCGACTVVVASLGGNGVTHRAINACIAFLPMLEATSITTVEGVAAVDDTLHPCQQAMIDCHASQCGFCTPGFILSLYALYLDRAEAPSVATIDDALAGNLCRCTGYGPIVAAAKKMFDGPRPGDEAARAARLAAQLAALQHTENICIERDGRRMFVPGSEAELARLYMAHPEATLIAGATDAALWVTKQGRALPVTIAIGRVTELARFADHTGAPIWLGARLTHADAARLLADRAPALAELWRRFAGTQVRNAGTVGGNIANGSPIGDLAPALIALGASVHLRRGDTRRELPLEDFFIGYGRQDRQPGEFVTGLAIPADARALCDLACHKVSKRFDDDISAVCGAFNIAIDSHNRIASARLAFGGMAAIPKRARAVEAALTGEAWTRATIDAALPEFAHDFQPIDDARASSTYRLQVAMNLLVRTYIERHTPQTATRLAGAAAIEIG